MDTDNPPVQISVFIRVHPWLKRAIKGAVKNESLTSYSISVPLHNFCKSSGKERTTDEHRWTRIPPRPDIRVYPRPSVVKKEQNHLIVSQRRLSRRILELASVENVLRSYPFMVRTANHV